MKHITRLLFVFFVLIRFSAIAQSERKHIREGNQQYEKNQYQDAEISYRKAIDKNNRTYEGVFNLGDALYKEKKYDDAANSFDMLTNQESYKNTKAGAYHNLGNSLLQSKKYEESIEAYKNALRNNPGDSDTKYNLAYAQAKLIQEKEQKQKQSEQDKNQENKDQDQKPQGEDKKNQKEQDNKKEQDKGEEKEQERSKQKEQQQPRPDKISKEDAQRLLDALNNEEKVVQEKLKKIDVKATKIKIEKDW